VNIVIIIPTYNEKDNIKRLIHELQDIFKTLPHDMKILFVDDNSPDDTANEIRGLMDNYDNIQIIQGEKKGLGKAYIRGMKYAIYELKADAVMEMDADFSHKPSDVPRLVNELAHYDFVIGSRYVAGGKIPDEWHWLRKLNSRVGNFAARYIAALYKIQDCTAGFRAINADLLKKINFEDIKVDGYGFQVSLLHKAVSNGARIREIPVIFEDRKYGISKLGISDIFHFIIEVWGIRFKK